ncbi:MAG TPA: flagellar biosynthesis protein FlhF [Steroidobacteraceae bacterium]|jgi:flagellar biosynthesis protein FlhF|nr:flagellar biosynthesis protein FlhF [Steroidobacteraceae bacterium]
MKIKRYTAVSMRAALCQVRAEQGPDAVILSSRRGADGIEVIAAVDYDEALFAEANRQRTPAISEAPPQSSDAPQPMKATPVIKAAPAIKPAPAIKATPAAVKTAPATKTPAAKAAPAVAAAPRALPQPIPATSVVAAGNIGLGDMQRELKDLRRMLESGLAGLAGTTSSDKRLRQPLRARVLEELTAMDIAPDVAMALAALAPLHTNLKDPAHIKLALLVKHLPVVNDLSSVNGGITAVVGPTGAGKTTTIAKLAARWCMQHGAADLGLVSTDSYRVGARDQLRTFARAVGVPLHAANSGKELALVLQQLKSKKLVLIDTAGMGPRDFRLVEQLAALKSGAPLARILLALPAQGEAHALDEIVRAFARATPAACIITKVDEAASLGAVISAALRHRLQIAYLCDGQRIPADLHAAHGKRVWLARAALALKERAMPLRSEVHLASNPNRGHVHA